MSGPAIARVQFTLHSGLAFTRDAAKLIRVNGRLNQATLRHGILTINKGASSQFKISLPSGAIRELHVLTARAQRLRHRPGATPVAGYATVQFVDVVGQRTTRTLKLAGTAS